MAVKLSEATLADLPADVGRPAYDRAAMRPGILHFGLGNFHRAHQARYLDRLMNAGRAADWAILGTGVMAADHAVMEALAPQSWLSTVIEEEAGESAATVIGPMTGMIDPGDRAGIVARLADPAIRIVSLTVTEGGYFVSAETGEFDAAHPAIRADAARPGAPETVSGLIVAGLSARPAAGHAPFTVLSCDNLPHNGVAARAAVTGLARASEPAFADWIAGEVAFPNAMVDRITPATDDAARARLAREFGIADAWPVFCERFTQWVLEDDFPAGRPPLEEAGAEFVADVTPFEAMKIRILNGGHALLAYPAGILGIELVHEAMEDDQIRAFLDRAEKLEIIPHVPPVPGTDLGAYFARGAERFANPATRDTVRRLCFDGSNRQPKFILPSLSDALVDGAPLGGLALASALWCRYCAGTTEAGAQITPNDPDWARLTEVAQAARARPAAWLEMTDVYGRLGSEPRFSAAFGTALGVIWSDGVRAALARYLSGGWPEG